MSLELEFVAAGGGAGEISYEMTPEVEVNLNAAMVKIQELIDEKKKWMPSLGIKQDHLRDEANRLINEAQRFLLGQHGEGKEKYRRGDLRNIDRGAFRELIRGKFGEEGLKTFSHVRKNMIEAPKTSGRGWWPF